MENFSHQWVPSFYMCFINKTRYKEDIKATETDVADADKEKQKRNEKPAFCFYRMRCQLQKRVPKGTFVVMGTSWYKKIQARWKRKASQLRE